MPTFSSLSPFNTLLDTPHLKKILKGFKAHREEAWVVGGSVRDALRGRPISDIDLATTAIPENAIAIVQNLGFKAIPTGMTHGTITAVREASAFEVTTLRRDAVTHGRHAEVVFGTSLLEDAARRDFTINALYVNAAGNMVDPLNGITDIDPIRVRFIGDPTQRIREDYLRILRFFRFSAIESGTLNKEGLEACVKEQAGLECLSKERITHEILRLMTAPFVSTVVPSLAKSGIWKTLQLPDAGLEQFTHVLNREAMLHLLPSAERRLLGVCAHCETWEHLDAALRLTRAFRQKYRSIQLCLGMWQSLISPSDLRRAVAAHPLDVVGDALCLTPHPFSSETQHLFADYKNGAKIPHFPIKSSDLQKEGWSGKALGEERARLFEEWLATL